MLVEGETYPLVMDSLPEEYVQVAQKELNETAEKRVDFLQDLMIRAKSDKTLKDLDLHPDFLLQFLRLSKFDIDVAFARLQKYINYRRKHPEFFTGVQDNLVSSSPSYRWASPLPWRSPEGCSLLVFKFGEWDPRHISFADLQRLVHMVVQQSLRYPATQINGLRAIMDFKNYSIRHLKYGTPWHLYQVVYMFLECCPARIKQINCVNCTSAMKIGWAILAQFMSDKLRKRVIFHAQPEDLSNLFPKLILPVEYGGEIKDSYMHLWMKEANRQMGLPTFMGLENNN